MALVIQCDICEEELEEPGALVFGPPGYCTGGERGNVNKFHLCTNCYIGFEDWIRKYKSEVLEAQK